MTAPAATVFSLPSVGARPETRVQPPSELRPRFTVDGDPALEAHLTTTCARIAAGLRGLLPRRKLEAVLLGGGYGRGEGGVLRTPDGDRPYNDLEFYVCLRGSRHLNERRYGRALHVLGEILTPQAGVEVEFRITSLRELAQSGVSMFSYDLICGHRWLVGDEPLLASSSHHRAADQIPLGEATRLLMNRCSGLLFAAERLGRATFTPGDADFVARNIAKAQLGAGDAMLTAYGQYHWSVRERHRLLERLARAETAWWLPGLIREHGKGVEFKLHPVRSTEDRDELKARHQQVADLCRQVWLWLEARRLGLRFCSIAEYVAQEEKCPELRGPRNTLVNAKVLGVKALAIGGAFRHPRNRVLTALPLLLWERQPTLPAPMIATLRRELHTHASGFPDFVAAYRQLWAQLN